MGSSGEQESCPLQPSALGAPVLALILAAGDVYQRPLPRHPAAQHSSFLMEWQRDWGRNSPLQACSFLFWKTRRHRLPPPGVVRIKRDSSRGVVLSECCLQLS